MAQSLHNLCDNFEISMQNGTEFCIRTSKLTVNCTKSRNSKILYALLPLPNRNHFTTTQARTFAHHINHTISLKVLNNGRDLWFKDNKPDLLKTNYLVNLPYIIDGDFVLAQTDACINYLGR